MKRNLLITVVLLALLPGIAKAQWTFDIVSVEAYINDHKKQRSLLLTRSTLEYSNKLLHEYSRKEVGGYKELNVDLDRYTRAFDIIDVLKDVLPELDTDEGRRLTLVEECHDRWVENARASKGGNARKGERP